MFVQDLKRGGLIHISEVLSTAVSYSVCLKWNSCGGSKCKSCK